MVTLSSNKNELPSTTVPSDTNGFLQVFSKKKRKKSDNYKVHKLNLVLTYAFSKYSSPFTISHATYCISAYNCVTINAS